MRCRGGRVRALRILFAVCTWTVGAALMGCGAGDVGEGEQGSAPAQARSRNVLLISIDSLRADHLASYGYERVTSPNLDRLAREGAVFEQSIAETSWTLPAHISMLTGLTSGVHGVLETEDALGSRGVMLAEVFQAAGFRTYGIWSGPYLHPYFGFQRGFSEGDWVSAMGERVDRAIRTKQAGTEDAHLAGVGRANALAHQGATSERIVDGALQFLDDVESEPFFLFLHLFDVHYDYTPPERYWRRFDPDYAGDHDPTNFIGNPLLVPDMPASELRHVLARYDGEIAYVDDWLGKLFDGLISRGLDRDTLVCVTSDHGDEFFEHGWKGHRRTLYDEVLAVPLIFSQPGKIGPGLRLTNQARHIDVMPTLLEWCQLPLPEGVMGRSLVPELLGLESAQAPPAIARYGDPASGRFWTALRTPDWKLIRRKSKKDALDQLDGFDLNLDPGETTALDGKRGSIDFDAAAKALAAMERREKERRAQLAAGGSSHSESVELPSEVEDILRDLGYVE